MFFFLLGFSMYHRKLWIFSENLSLFGKFLPVFLVSVESLFFPRFRKMKKAGQKKSWNQSTVNYVNCFVDRNLDFSLFYKFYFSESLCMRARLLKFRIQVDERQCFPSVPSLPFYLCSFSRYWRYCDFQSGGITYWSLFCDHFVKMPSQLQNYLHYPLKTVVL